MRATVLIEVRTNEGELVASRFARNSVMRTGAQLMARLFSGGGTAGITHMVVGTSSAEEPGTFETKELKNDDTEGTPTLTGDTSAPVSPADFAVETDLDKHVVRVRVRATLPNAAAVGTLREAGLAGKTGDGTFLYNRVIFAPIEKRNDHELTMFWEVTFPYGDLSSI
jgi:hypothetical protein